VVLGHREQFVAGKAASFALAEQRRGLLRVGLAGRRSPPAAAGDRQVPGPMGVVG
jgi:hypothetical protein